MIRIKKIRLLASAAVLCAMSVSAQAPGDLRVALVIGNAAYTGAAALANPVNDAAAMSATLKGLGFSVLEVKDGTREQMAQAIAQTRQTLAGKKGVGMLYYAGHGLQLDWRNYMVPVDAKLGSAAEVPQQTVDVNSVIDAFKTAGNRMNIVVLDACRDNPFADKGTGKGLAQLDAPPGTFLAYATAPGNVAEDGDAKSANGLYTSFLLQELKKPQARIEDVFKRVRFGVRQASSGRQIPWESTSLEDDFYFDASPVRPARLSSREEEAQFELERSAWERALATGRVADLFAFIQQFPAGRFAEQAMFRINLLQRPAVDVAPSRLEAQRLGAGGATLPALTGYVGPRFRAGDEFSILWKDGLNAVERGRFALQVREATTQDVRFTETGLPMTRDLMGALIRDASFTYDPPLVDMPAEFSVGKRWTGRTLVSGQRYFGPFRAYMTYQGRVVGREMIQVGAQQVEVFAVELSGSLNMATGGGMTIEMKSWFNPRIGLPVKHHVVVRSPQSEPRRSSELFEMTAMQVKS